MFSFRLVVLAVGAWVLSGLKGTAADQIIYSDDALSNGWQDWSWGSTIDYEAADMAEGTSSVSVNSTAWAAFSLKSPSTDVGSFAGLRFDISVSFFCLFVYRVKWSSCQWGDELLMGLKFFRIHVIGRSTGTSVLYPEHDG